MKETKNTEKTTKQNVFEAAALSDDQLNEVSGGIMNTHFAQTRTTKSSKDSDFDFLPIAKNHSAH